MGRGGDADEKVEQRRRWCEGVGREGGELGGRV